MRHIGTIPLILMVFTFCRCGESDYDPIAIPKNSYTKTLSTSYSPDSTKILTLKEHGWTNESGYTQVFIEFASTGAGVYSVDTTGVDIKTYWKDNGHIIIETKKTYKGHQKWNQVQSFKDIVKVTYLEK